MRNNKYLEKGLLFLLWSSLLWILTLILPSTMNQCGTEIVKNLIYLVIVFCAVQISSGHLMKERISSSNKAVLITGCDSGFGHNVAKRLDQRGFVVFATCLFPSGEGAISLRRTCSSRVHVIGMDVTKDDSVHEALKYVKEHLKKTEFWAVVNNAGIFQGFDIELTGLDKFTNNFEVNTLGVIRVTKAFLPLLRQFKGRVVTVTSLAGRISLPFLAAYCMSKFAAVSFCECLRQEMYPWGVKVISIEPEIYRTPITDVTRIQENIDDNWRNATEEIRAAYGESYIEEVKACIESVINFASPKIYKVVDCIEDAVMSAEPCNTYKPYRHLSFKVLGWVGEKLPKPILDWIFRTYLKFMNFPTPIETALRK